MYNDTVVRASVRVSTYVYLIVILYELVSKPLHAYRSLLLKISLHHAFHVPLKYMFLLHPPVTTDAVTHCDIATAAATTAVCILLLDLPPLVSSQTGQTFCS